MEYSLRVFLIVMCVVRRTDTQRRFDMLRKDMPSMKQSGPTSSPADYALGMKKTGVHPSCSNFGERANSTDTTEIMCVCKNGFVGSPPNCTVGDRLWEACYHGNACGPHSECDIDDNDNRQCSCMFGYVGTPPNCHPESEYNSICETCDPNSECSRYSTLRHLSSVCHCVAGFVGEAPNCTAGPMLLQHCDPYPCGPNSWCEKRGGAAMCSCLPGYNGEPPHCEPGSELWRVCFKRRTCDRNSTCALGDRGPLCTECEPGFRSETPYCLPIEE